MIPWRLVAPFAAVSVLACSSSTDISSSGGTTSGTGGSSSTTGTGGTTTTTGTGGTGTTSSSTSTGGQGTGGAGCVGYIDLVADNGAPKHLASACASDSTSGSTMANGYLYAGGIPGSDHGLAIGGCVSPAANAEGILLRASGVSGPTTATTGSTQWTDDSGNSWGQAGDSFSMTVTKLGPNGEPIEGTFEVSATHAGGDVAHFLTGTFHVCHGNDFFPP